MFDCDILPLCQHTFLPHVFSEVFHKILLAKGVEHIVAWNDVAIQYARLRKATIYLSGTQVQSAWEIADAVFCEIYVIVVHICNFSI